jgi:hypothetical protein
MLAEVGPILRKGLGVVLLAGIAVALLKVDIERATALLTYALVLVTLWYAKHTRDMALEMKTSRDAESERRLRDKSETAAMQCLAVLRDADRSFRTLGAAGVPREIFRELHRELRNHAVFLRDELLRDHVDACAEVAFVAGFDEAALRMERLRGGIVALEASSIADATRRSLERYLREEPQPSLHWHKGTENGQSINYPTHGDAASWIRERAKAEPE